jgi:hypothetical protein
MWVERRNNRQRAEYISRLIGRLRASHGGLGTAELAHEPLSPATLERILKRFALKGFVRHIQNRWWPTRLLLRRPCRVVPG